MFYNAIFTSSATKAVNVQFLLITDTITQKQEKYCIFLSKNP